MGVSIVAGAQRLSLPRPDWIETLGHVADAAAGVELRTGADCRAAGRRRLSRLEPRPDRWRTFMSSGIDKHANRSALSRRPFVIRKPDSLSRRAYEEVVRTGKKTILHALDELINSRASTLNFETCYRAAYNLTMRKQGDWVLAEAVGALRRLNLKPYDDERYWKVATAIDDVLMFPNKTLATGEGRETTLQTARRLRGERALQLWRLLTTKWAAGLGRVDIWKARVAEWRLAFDTVCFRPDESGARHARRHFLATARLHSYS